MPLPPSLIRARYRASDLAFCNALAPLMAHLPWREADIWHSISVAPLGAPTDFAVEFGLRFGSDTIGVALEHWPPGSFFLNPPEPPFHELPTAMALPLLEVALSGSLKMAESAIGRRVALESKGPEQSPGDLHFRFQWRVRRDAMDCVLSGALKVPQSSRAGLLSVLGKRRRRLLMPWASIPVPLSLSVGNCFLVASQLAQLRPGDVVLCDHSAGPDGLFLRLPPQLMVRGQFDPERRRLKIIALMENPAPNHPSEALLRSPDEIPVELLFELGTTTLPLGQFKQLSVGSVIDCPGISLDAPVTVRVHGARVATAELVMAGDRLGIRLLHIFQG